MLVLGLPNITGNMCLPLQDNTVREPFKIPILAFKASLAPDGLPMLTDWMATSTSIWALKYEGWREPFEFKASDGPTMGGTALDFGTLEVVKGCGRMTILLFSLVYTYLHLKNQLDDEALRAFEA